MISKTHIFAVAVENYQDTSINPVNYAENDARKFVEAWKELGVDEVDCVVLLSSQATMAAFKSRLRRFLSNVKLGDRIVFFYAGHGAAFSDASHITVHDTQRGDIQNTSIPLSEILTELRKSPSSKALLFLDSCHSGLPINADMRSIYSAFTGDELIEFCKDAEFHLAFSSCKVNEYSYPSRTLKHGIWTHCVIQAISGYAKSALERGRLVTASSIQGYLREEVPRILRMTITGAPSQTPCMWGNTTKELIVADLSELLRQRKLAEVSPTNIIKDSSLIGEDRGQVSELSGYRKPLHPLSTHNSWEQNFVETSGESEVTDLVTEIYEKVRTSLGYKRRDISFANAGSSATINTPDFDVNVSLTQDPNDADEYVLKTEVASFRRPEVIDDPSFLKIFNKYCDSVVIELESNLDLKEKIDEIEEIEKLAKGLNYDPECTEFTLQLPDSGIVLYATSDRMVFSLLGHGDLKLLIGNTHKAVSQLAGVSVTLGLPDNTKP